MAEHDDLPDPLPKKLGGPPKRHFKEGERVALSLRMTPELKRRLDEAADQGGRSQSQEAEFRLEQSFRQQDLLPQVLTLACSSKEVAGIATMLVLSMAGLGYRYSYDPRWMGKKPRHWHWISDPRAFDQVVQNIVTILNALHPGGPRVRLTGMKRGWGVETANAIVRAIRGDSKRTYPLPVDTIRDMLGPLAANLTKARADSLDIREWGSPYPLGKTTSLNVADAILNLINSSPRTPSREEIASVILAQMKLPGQKEPKP